jgi:acetoin utilization protein AcuB
MLVKDYMARHPITIGPDTKLVEAQRIMASSGIKHLPVVDDDKRLVGILTPSRFAITPEKLASLNIWEISDYLTGLKASQLMVKGNALCTIDPEATLEEAAERMLARSITGLPVVEDGVVVGIITQVDLLFELRNLLGSKEKGWRVTVRVPDRKGEFGKLVETIYGNGWGLMAMGSVRSPRHPECWDVVVKISRCEDDHAIFDALGAIPGHKIVDVRES